MQKAFGTTRVVEGFSLDAARVVSLARALAREPQILLLDEPLSALDAKIRVSLRDDLRALQRKLGITAIFVTHDQEEALALSDRVVVMNKGRVEQIGTPSEIYSAPATRFVAGFVGAMNVLECTIVDSLPCTDSRSPWPFQHPISAINPQCASASVPRR